MTLTRRLGASVRCLTLQTTRSWPRHRPQHKCGPEPHSTPSRRTHEVLETTSSSPATARTTAGCSGSLCDRFTIANTNRSLGCDGRVVIVVRPLRRLVGSFLVGQFAPLPL